MPVYIAPQDSDRQAPARSLYPGHSLKKKRRRLSGRKLTAAAKVVLVAALLAVAAIPCVALVRGSWMVTPVLSGSMRPGLAVGGVAISQRVPVSSLAVRDVIVFRSPSDPSQQYVHRIVRLQRTASGAALINTQGDANTVRDPWTLTIRGSYAYRVRWSLPLIGYAAVALQNHRGLIVAAAGVVLLAVAVALILRARRASRAPASYSELRLPSEALD